MNNQQYIEWREDIERCTRLYDGFADAAPFINAAVECVYKFFKDYFINPQPVFYPKEVDDFMRAGKPLEIKPALDTRDIVELLKRMSKDLSKTNPELKGTVQVLEESFERFLLNSQSKVCKEEMWNLGDLLVKEGVLEQDLATFLFSIALSSFYRQLLQSIAESLRTDLWEEGNCPLCGEKPHYGLLRPEDGAKELECWLCGTKWAHPRIKCPFCGNEEQGELGYFTAENREICRINFCQRCRQYYKIIDARKFPASGDIILAIHNLASLSYDLLAREEGFTPGSGLGWVNLKELTSHQEVVREC